MDYSTPLFLGLCVSFLRNDLYCRATHCTHSSTDEAAAWTTERSADHPPARRESYARSGNLEKAIPV